MERLGDRPPIDEFDDACDLDTLLHPSQAFDLRT